MSTRDQDPGGQVLKQAQRATPAVVSRAPDAEKHSRGSDDNRAGQPVVTVDAQRVVQRPAIVLAGMPASSGSSPQLQQQPL